MLVCGGTRQTRTCPYSLILAENINIKSLEFLDPNHFEPSTYKSKHLSVSPPCLLTAMSIREPIIISLSQNTTSLRSTWSYLSENR